MTVTVLVCNSQNVWTTMLKCQMHTLHKVLICLQEQPHYLKVWHINTKLSICIWVKHRYKTACGAVAYQLMVLRGCVKNQVIYK